MDKNKLKKKLSKAFEGLTLGFSAIGISGLATFAFMLMMLKIGSYGVLESASFFGLAFWCVAVWFGSYVLSFMWLLKLNEEYEYYKKKNKEKDPFEEAMKITQLGVAGLVVHAMGKTKSKKKTTKKGVKSGK